MLRVVIQEAQRSFLARFWRQPDNPIGHKFDHAIDAAVAYALHRQVVAAVKWERSATPSPASTMPIPTLHSTRNAPETFWPRSFYAPSTHCSAPLCVQVGVKLAKTRTATGGVADEGGEACTKCGCKRHATWNLMLICDGCTNAFHSVTCLSIRADRRSPPMRGFAPRASHRRLL